MNNQRFIIVAGKGGVGRSTLSAALALSFSRKNMRTLLATADTQAKHLSKIFGHKIGPRNTKIGKNLYAVNIHPMESIKEYTLMILKIRYLQYLLVGTQAMQSFISNIPGISEWAIMGKVTYHLIEKKNGKHLYDRIILDAPPTGHSLSLIKIPLYISNVISSGPLHAVALERLSLIRDPGTTGILLVSIPEEMAVSEALDLYENIRSDIKIPVIAVLMNRTTLSIFTEDEELKIREMACGSNPENTLKAALFRMNRTKLQQKQIKRIQKHLPVVQLPEINKWRLETGDIEALADILENNLFT